MINPENLSLIGLWKKIKDKKQYKNESFYPTTTDQCNFNYYIEYQKEIEDKLIECNYNYDLIKGSDHYHIYILCNGETKGNKCFFYEREWTSVYNNHGCFWYIPYVESEYKMLEGLISKQKDFIKIETTKDFTMQTITLSMKITKIYDFTVISYNSNMLFGCEDNQLTYQFLELKTILIKYEDLKKRNIKMTITNIKNLCFYPQSYTNIFYMSVIYKMKNIPKLEDMIPLSNEDIIIKKYNTKYLNLTEKTYPKISDKRYLTIMKKKAFYLLKCAGYMKNFEGGFRFNLLDVFDDTSYSTSYKKDYIDSYIILNYLLNNNLNIGYCEICDTKYIVFRDLKLEYICDECMEKVDSLVKGFDVIFKEFVYNFKAMARIIKIYNNVKVPSLYYLSLKKFFNENVFVFDE